MEKLLDLIRQGYTVKIRIDREKCKYVVTVNDIPENGNIHHSASLEVNIFDVEYGKYDAILFAVIECVGFLKGESEYGKGL